MSQVHGATAFIVVLPDDGTPAYVVTAIGATEFDIAREATFSDVRRACHEVTDDLIARAVKEYLDPHPPEQPSERVAKAVSRKRG